MILFPIIKRNRSYLKITKRDVDLNPDNPPQKDPIKLTSFYITNIKK